MCASDTESSEAAKSFTALGPFCLQVECYYFGPTEGGTPMKNAKGQEVQWVLDEDWLAYSKETMSPEKYAEFEAFLKRFRE